MGKKIYIGSDNAGYPLKLKCIEYLESKDMEYVDCGCGDDKDIEATRYPFFAAKVACAVSKGEADFGILICGTGIGMSMMANKFPGVRAALLSSTYQAKMTRSHNDANIICMGGMTAGEWEAMDILEVFLNTPYDGSFHDGSLNLIKEAEQYMGNGSLWEQEPYKISTGVLKDDAVLNRKK